jgi:hypothetical protein
MRFELNQNLFAVQFMFARDLKGDRISMFSQPLMYNNEMPHKINFVKLTVTEHHKVRDSYESNDKPATHDGFLLKDDQGSVYANQYPTASFGQMSDEANRRFHLHETDENSDEMIARLKATPNSFYECHLLSDVLEKIMKGIRDLSEIAESNPNRVDLLTKIELLKKLQEQIKEEFLKAYPEYEMHFSWRNAYHGSKLQFADVSIFRHLPLEKALTLSHAEIQQELQDNGVLEVEYPNGDLLCMKKDQGTYLLFGEKTDVDYTRVYYGEKTESLNGSDKPSFMVSQTEYFDIDKDYLPAQCFRQRLHSENPNRAKGMGSSLEELAVAQSIRRLHCRETKDMIPYFGGESGERRYDVLLETGAKFSLVRMPKEDGDLITIEHSIQAPGSDHRAVTAVVVPKSIQFNLAVDDAIGKLAMDEDRPSVDVTLEMVIDGFKKLVEIPSILDTLDSKCVIAAIAHAHQLIQVKTA